MIQTKQPLYYEDRGNKFSKIRIEIDSFITDANGTSYNVNDWAIQEDGSRILHKTKTVRYSNEMINQLDAFIEANNDLSELSKTQKEWKKIQLALYIDTTTNLFDNGKTIYRLQPLDWEFSE
jgi:hypothetical protein